MSIGWARVVRDQIIVGGVDDSGVCGIAVGGAICNGGGRVKDHVGVSEVGEE